MTSTSEAQTRARPGRPKDRRRQRARRRMHSSTACAQQYVVLPEEDAAEFAALEAALIEELAPIGRPR